MRYVFLNGSIIGHNTENMLSELQNQLEKQISESDSIQLIDLKGEKIPFSDGRNWLDNTGDTLKILKEVMEADVLIFGVPTY